MRLHTGIDIQEDEIIQLGRFLLEILLKDKTTKQNIIWATKDYLEYGPDYEAEKEIFVSQITGTHAQIIQPRVTKEKNSQVLRTKDKAEVFTPSWVCNKQNNLIDAQWFGYDNVFNTETENAWVVNSKKVYFPNNKKWQKYVDSKRLEVTCGEAPYLVSRYDTVSGKKINVNRRIGLLDRKLRVINENVDDEEQWITWATRAFQSVYGYEYQGDNLLLARENLLFTYIDNFKYKFNEIAEYDDLVKIANIVAWNIWQMDGITCTVPFGEVVERYEEYSLFQDESDEMEKRAKEPLCKIMDWRSKESLYFKSMIGVK